MTMIHETNRQIDSLLRQPLYGLSPDERERKILPLFRCRLRHAADRCQPYARYVRSWPIPPEAAQRISDLPYFPVSAFKRKTPLSSADSAASVRTIVSSTTSGQIPSRIVVDAVTSRLMARGAAEILKDFIGAQRRPLLIVDAPQSSDRSKPLGARGAAVRALTPFATRIETVLEGDQLALDVDKLLSVCAANEDSAIILYGFTYVLWLHFVETLRRKRVCLGLRNAHVLHSGGWKAVESQAVSKQEFNETVSEVVGCDQGNIIDFYGLVENVGVIYPDCQFGNKHVPSFGEVLIRDPLTLGPVEVGQPGIVQVSSLLPTSFPGHLLLTDDLGEVVCLDRCRCGRRGLAFRVRGRIPAVEVRGCGNVLAQRLAESGAGTVPASGPLLQRTSPMGAAR